MQGKFRHQHAQDILALLAEAASHHDRCAAGNTNNISYRPPPNDDRLAAIAKAIVVREVPVRFPLTIQGYK